jgi:RNA recognition motif-containing protein
MLVWCVVQIEDVKLFYERRSHTSKGCGFVNMNSRVEAVLAIEGLHQKLTMPVGSILH